MKPISDILVPLDGSPTALHSLGVAVWLGSRLDARLHVLNAGQPKPVDEAMARLGIVEMYRARVEVHQIARPAPEAILSGINQYGAGLVVMTTHGESASVSGADHGKIVGHVTREIMERTDVPVLVLPRNYRESLPWRSALVPLSGEATDESLTLALQLSHALNLRVAIAHVAAGEGEATSRQYMDEAHHEFARILNQLVAGACPACSQEERSRIEAFHLAQGDVGEELLRLAEQKDASLVVLGWRGEFMIGHARVIKRLMREIRCPMLMVKPQPRPAFRLKVGEAFE